MKWPIVLLLISTRALAWGSDVIAVGPIVSCQDPTKCFVGLAVRDPNHFDQKTLEYGFPRYGFGYGGIVLGNGVGLDMASSGGFLTKNTNDLLRGAAEIGGRIWANTNGSVRSHYAWHPGLGLGPSFAVGPARVTILAKSGVDASNLGYSDLLPRFRLYGAASLYLHSDPISFGAEWLTRDGQVQVQADVLLHVYKTSTIGVRAEQLGGQTSFAIIWQSSPF